MLKKYHFNKLVSRKLYRDSGKLNIRKGEKKFPCGKLCLVCLKIFLWQFFFLRFKPWIEFQTNVQVRSIKYNSGFPKHLWRMGWGEGDGGGTWHINENNRVCSLENNRSIFHLVLGGVEVSPMSCATRGTL